MRVNPVVKGPVKRRGDWRWSSHDSLALDNATAAACPVRLITCDCRWGTVHEKSPRSERH